MQALVQELSGLVPDWTIGPALILGAIFVALLVHKVARVLVKRAIGRRNSILLPILQRTAGPARLALCLAAVALVLPLAPLNEGWRRALAHVFVVATIALVGWITMRVVD